MAKPRTLRRADCLQDINRAMRAAEAGDDAAALKWLKRAVLSDRFGELNERRGYRDKRSGRPLGSKGANIDDSAALAFMRCINANNPQDAGPLADVALDAGYGREHSQRASNRRRLIDKWKAGAEK